jgi:hypothetical protein
LRRQHRYPPFDKLRAAQNPTPRPPTEHIGDPQIPLTTVRFELAAAPNLEDGAHVFLAGEGWQSRFTLVKRGTRQAIRWAARE